MKLQKLYPRVVVSRNANYTRVARVEVAPYLVIFSVYSVLTRYMSCTITHHAIRSRNPQY